MAYQLFVRCVDGQTLCLQLPSPCVTGSFVKRAIEERRRIPVSLQRLSSGCREIASHSVISSGDGGLFPSCNLSLRLVGGKGGFGSLLRGAGSKGKKKNENMDACRDMSGRRLRHVNAEKKLVEWQQQAEERELERKGQAYLKQLAKQQKKEKDYSEEVLRFREESEAAIERVADAVGVGLQQAKKQEEERGRMMELEEKKRGKRKLGEGEEEEAEGHNKSLKMFSMLGGIEDEEESDDEDEDEEDDREDEEDEGEEEEEEDLQASQLVARPSGSGSLGTVPSGTAPPDTVHGDEILPSSFPGDGAFKFGNATGSQRIEGLAGGKGVARTERKVEGGAAPAVAATTAVGAQVEEAEERTAGTDVGKQSKEEDGEGHGLMPQGTDAAAAPVPPLTKAIDRPDVSTEQEEEESPLDFSKFASAKDLEILGLDRLKELLQCRGLKCGGSLLERASRLFLLKTTPLAALDKRLLANAKSFREAPQKNTRPPIAQPPKKQRKA